MSKRDDLLRCENVKDETNHARWDVRKKDALCG